MSSYVGRVLVQLLEAKRLADRGDESYIRLALLLLDNLAETLMFREVRSSLQFDRIYRSLLSQLEVIAVENPDAIAQRDEMRAKVLSKTRLRKIRTYFGAKAAYLVDQDKLDPAIARALVKLHQYRNETYHEDSVRPEIVQAAVDIYFYLACLLMKNLPPRRFSSDDILPPDVATYLDGEANVWFDTSERFADAMLLERQLGHEEVNLRLQEHLLLRVERIRHALDSWSTDVQSPANLLHLAQVPDDAIRTMRDLLDIASVQVEHDMSSLDHWEERARGITPAMTVLAAFGQFADIEDELEPLESKVMEMVARFEEAIEMEQDRLRGK